MVARRLQGVELLALIWMSLVSLFSLAQSAMPVAELVGPDPNALREVLSDEVPVSGRVVAGVTLHGFPGGLPNELPNESPASDSPATLFLYAAQEDTRGEICLQVMSRDGRYWSENAFRSQPVGVGGQIAVRYETSYTTELQAFGSDDVAILSYPWPCGNRESDLYLPGAFGAAGQDAAEPTLKIYVNSARADTFLRIARGDRRDTIKCHRFDKGRRTGYDTLCSAPVLATDFEQGVVDVKIYRRKYERSLAPESLRVRLPALAAGH